MYSDYWDDLDELVALVMQNNAEQVIHLIESGNFDKSLLEDVGCCEYPLPLYKLSLCNMILLDTDGWRSDILPIVEQNRQNCGLLLDYWRTRWNYPVDVPMDFESYQYECAHFSDWDMDELLDGDLDTLKAMGYDEDEVEFCYAVLTYKADLIQKHLGLKTNPDVCISASLAPGEGKAWDGESHNALNDCYSFCWDEFHCYDLWRYWSSSHVEKVRVGDAQALLQVAAYCDLEEKLEKLKIERSR